MKGTMPRYSESRLSMEYRVYHEGQRFICPECGGLVYGKEEKKKCYDCKIRYRTVGEGDYDREMIYERIGNESRVHRHRSAGGKG
jgi:hypothetical protein